MTDFTILSINVHAFDWSSYPLGTDMTKDCSFISCHFLAIFGHRTYELLWCRPSWYVLCVYWNEGMWALLVQATWVGSQATPYRRNLQISFYDLEVPTNYFLLNWDFNSKGRVAWRWLLCPNFEFLSVLYNWSQNRGDTMLASVVASVVASVHLSIFGRSQKHFPCIFLYMFYIYCLFLYSKVYEINVQW